MKNILVPIDGSEGSVRALQAAINLAKTLNGDSAIFAVNVQAPIISGNVTRFFSAEDINAFYQDEGRVALAPAIPVLEASGVKFTHEVVVGPIAPTLIEYGKKHNCDQIFMGTRGLGPVSGLILGSIATKVISLSAVPVTLVK
ncbi:universal stress protein [Pusillimonas sp. TS35]|uniref:universal stress protein n=1 Tax=Paracandidimonas lactea TaxID=2895524 RepID=UPI00136BAE53|nr:universal stress protein [Paracandidimonas lactea]MYN12119.1 universal stress protein [Pusillimonas sp. TS35]